MPPQTLFITGCSSGFGLAIARIAMAAGHTVIGTSRKPSTELVEEFSRAGTGSKLIAFDVNRADSGEAFAELMKETPIDILVNNAGWAKLCPVEALDEDSARGMMETMYFAPMRLVRAAVPVMRERKSGVIVSVSSGAGLEGRESMSGYASAKAAIDSAMTVLAKEVTPFGLRVLTVQLGAFDTHFVAAASALPSVGDSVKQVYAGSVTEKVMQALTSPDTFKAAGDHIKASQVIYDVVMGEGVGKGREAERVLPLGSDMAKRISEVMDKWRRVLDTFGDVCNSVNKSY